MTLEEATTALLSEAAHKERRPPKYGFSDATQCGREHVYAEREIAATGKLRPAPTPLRWIYQVGCGDGVGEKLEAAARRLGWLTQVPVRWEVDGIVIEGTADIVGPDFVLDGKYVSSGSWRMIQSIPKREHWLQVHGYAFALGKPRVGLIYQRFMEKGETVPFCLHEGDTDPEVAGEIVSHWRQIDGHRKAGTLPPRDFEFGSFECKNCIYQPECWSGVSQ